MNDVRLSSAIMSFIMSSVRSAVFLYLWVSTRHRHLAFWTAALAMNAAILICTALRVTRPEMDSPLRLCIDLLGGSAAISITVGTVIFAQVDKKDYRKWLRIPLASMAWSIVSNLRGMNPLIESFPVSVIVGVSIMSIGVLFFALPHLSRWGASPYVAICLIIWGGLNGSYPLSLRYDSISPLGHYGAVAMSLMTGMFLMVVSVEEQREQTENEKERLSATLSSIGDAVIVWTPSATSRC